MLRVLSWKGAQARTDAGSLNLACTCPSKGKHTRKAPSTERYRHSPDCTACASKCVLTSWAAGEVKMALQEATMHCCASAAKLQTRCGWWTLTNIRGRIDATCRNDCSNHILANIRTEALADVVIFHIRPLHTMHKHGTKHHDELKEMQTRKRETSRKW